MTIDAKTKTTQQIAHDSAHVAGVLLLRFERDINWLMDAASLAERDKTITLIRDAVRINLMIDASWSNETATRMANEYEGALRHRLARPEFYRKRTGDA